MFLRSMQLTRCARLATALPFALLIGCSHNEKEPQLTPASGVRTPPTQAAPRVDEPQTTVSSSGSFNLSEGVRTRCNLPDEPREDPQFDFDDAGLRDRGKRILDGVADCMLNGALKDESLTIVGHADPRGPDDYNQELGARRAESARDYLMQRGVPLARMTVQSHGERDATGTDESSWQLDRRIDIDETTPANAGVPFQR